ncbi:hypothetical protein E1A91_D05G292500v1 [Gossypium mustelinum]|uniref:Uncharacterized protein n=1 Tax=Gossypium mustelinum TaxID=34275 RepID=A0A5D2V2B3_GOSMU|nr:hypothetical protein E1A91_D05G292500v1 [Gossypium mustelinum]
MGMYLTWLWLDFSKLWFAVMLLVFRFVRCNYVFHRDIFFLMHFVNRKQAIGIIPYDSMKEPMEMVFLVLRFEGSLKLFKEKF